MPDISMSAPKKTFKNKQIKAELAKELTFVKNVFSLLSIPQRADNEENADYEMVNDSEQNVEDNKTAKRARNIAELEEKLQKLKSQNKFTLKNKLVKKSLSSKLNKKIKKRDRTNKNHVKPFGDVQKKEKVEVDSKIKANIAKPVFNNDGKLVFSKFDFANDNRKERKSGEKDPRKILDNLKQQQEKIRQLEETEGSKAKEVKEKVAWKSVLQKAEGQKVKDDPTLLKKSIKRMEQQKKQSKKKWENRIKSVEQKKEERQKTRKENIGKKKKEKKSKIVKAAVKRGRVVI